MKNTFSIDLTDINVADKITEVKQLIESNGGTFDGDAICGTFSSKACEGMYQTLFNMVTITITEKQIGIPFFLIKSVIVGYFSKS